VGDSVVNPAGKPLTVPVTMPLKPFTPVAVKVTLCVVSGYTDKDVGLTESVNDGGPSTVSAKDALCESDPLEPVIVTVSFETAAAVDAAVKVTTCDPPAVMVNVAGEAVTPEGSPLMETEMADEKPLSAVALRFTDSDEPGLIDMPAWFTLKPKSGVFGGAPPPWEDPQPVSPINPKPVSAHPKSKTNPKRL